MKGVGLSYLSCNLYYLKLKQCSGVIILWFWPDGTEEFSLIGFIAGLEMMI